jgi:hypothetical protein
MSLQSIHRHTGRMEIALSLLYDCRLKFVCAKLFHTITIVAGSAIVGRRLFKPMQECIE